jgi:MFS family permease
MQRTAQDWLVFTELTETSATALGMVMALQFGPQFLLLPLTGYAADHFPLRKLVFITQSTMALLALVLGVLVVSGQVQLWHVYLIALLLGCTTAFDMPARQTFVSELVPDHHLTNAVALNSTSFQSARLVGPAVAGLLIALVGTGWVFLINGFSFIAILLAISLMRADQLRYRDLAATPPGGMLQGFRYIAANRQILIAMLMFMLIGTFAINFPVYLSTMGVKEFGVGAGRFGLMTSMIAVGSVLGALMAANREQPGMRHLLLGALLLGCALSLAALMPGLVSFCLVLVLVGVSAQTFMTSVNSAVQMWTIPVMRGRVISIVFALSVGGTPLGALSVGWVADSFGPRLAMGVGAAAGFLAAGVGLFYVLRYGIKEGVRPPGSPPAKATTDPQTEPQGAVSGRDKTRD